MPSQRYKMSQRATHLFKLLRKHCRSKKSRRYMYREKEDISLDNKLIVVPVLLSQSVGWQ